MAKNKRFYWDSCAWIGLISAEDDKRRELEIIYQAARRGHLELWTSTISLVEVHRLPSEVGLSKPWPSENNDIFNEAMLQPFVKLVPVDMQIALNARVLVRSTPGLKKKPDAIHLASALRWPVEAMHTYDNDDLIHLSGRFDNTDGDKLKICYPDEETDGPLFAQVKNESQNPS